MQIQIRLYGLLARYGKKFGIHWVEIESGLSLEQLVNLLNIPRSSISFIVINGNKKSFDYQLRDQDKVMIFPHVAGG